jgi:hypothetical protein
MSRALKAFLLAAAAARTALGLDLFGGAAPPEDIDVLMTGPAAPSQSYKRLPVFPEKLRYQIFLGVVPVGQAALEAEHVVEFNGRPAYHIVSRAESNRFCDAFYKVRDFNESWMDARRLASLGYSKILSEGRFYRREWAVYDAANRRFVARLTNRDGSYKIFRGTVPASIQDILSSLFYIRSQKLVPGRDIVLDVNTKTNWPLIVRVLKREKIRTPSGTWRTVVVEPGLRKREGIFVQKGRNLRVWLTDDEKKIPVRMSVQLFFGHVSALLIPPGTANLAAPAKGANYSVTSPKKTGQFRAELSP